MNERIRLLRKELGLNQSDFGNKNLSDLGIDGDYEGIGHCAIVYAAVPAPASAPRKGNYVYYVK